MRPTRARLIAAALACLMAPTPAGAVLDPAIKCQAAKLKLSGKYAACRILADAAATRNDEPADYSTCDAKLQAGWQKVEDSIGAECPTLSDDDDVEAQLVECLPFSRYVVHFSVTSNQTFGALQFHTDYSAATGEFPGSISDVECTNVLPSAVLAARDDDHLDPPVLVVGVVPLSGATGPLEVARCVFEIGGFEAPMPAQFPIQIEDATDPNGNPLSGVTMAVSISKEL